MQANIQKRTPKLTAAALLVGAAFVQLGTQQAHAALPATGTTAIPTYEAAGLYWQSPGGTAGCQVKYRKATDRMPPDEFWEDTEETDEEKKERQKRDLEKRGILLADGRVHAAWNQLTTSGRANCTQPNMQNKRRKSRDMVEP